MDIVIHYNPERGYDEAALMLARRLFAVLDEKIDSLALIPVSEVDFDLWFNGCLVHSQSQSGRPPRVADILRVAEIDKIDVTSGT